MFLVIEIREINEQYCKRHLPLYDVKYVCDSYDTAKCILEYIIDTCRFEYYYDEINDLVIKDLGREVWTIKYRIIERELYGTKYNGNAYNLRIYSKGDIFLKETPYRYLDYGWFSNKQEIYRLHIYKVFYDADSYNGEIYVDRNDKDHLILIDRRERFMFPFLSIVEYKIYRRILLS